MLKSIYCDQLKTKANPSGMLSFHPGLNVILGTNRGTTSIGKSTALLLVDFAFGGDTYAKHDAVRELGDHTVYSLFEFDGTEYRFARNTSSLATFAQMDAQGQVVGDLNKQEFGAWMAEQYGIDFPDLQFRNTVSRFFRIYGKNNYNELRPLEVRGGTEGQKKAIDVLIRLFNRYEEILEFELQLQRADEKIKAFKAARKYEFIPSSVDGKTKYQENTAEIEVLRQKKQELESSDNRRIDQEEIVKANQVNELMLQLRDRRAELRRKKSDLHLINLNMQQGVYPTEADLQSLQRFFPEANLRSLLDIERFHNKIQAILQDELEAAKDELQNELGPLEEQVEQIQRRIQEIQPSMAFSREFLDAYTTLDRRIHKLEDENKAFDTRSSLDEEKKSANERLKAQIHRILNELESTIQAGMNEISDVVSNGVKNAPELHLNEYDSYSFETPCDTGTGTNFRGMLIYDLTILEKTALPAIAHDSNLFSNMEDADVARLLKLYAQQTDKQVFVSLDHQSRLGPEVEQLVKDHTVIALGPEDRALFGGQWGKKDAHDGDSR